MFEIENAMEIPLDFLSTLMPDTVISRCFGVCLQVFEEIYDGAVEGHSTYLLRVSADKKFESLCHQWPSVAEIARFLGPRLFPTACRLSHRHPRGRKGTQPV